jgi:hypothetical protein
MTNETLRMQMLAGVITEGEYKTKLQENEMAAVGEKVEAAVEDKLEATVDNLSDEQKSQLRAELAKAGITANSKIEDVVSKLDESLNEVEGDTKTKVANALSNVGGALMKSMLVPLIPLVVGKITGTGFGGGVAITAGTAGALIALAKLLGTEKTQDSLNEHYVAGGIVGIGAINQIPPREKANYETAFEHFLGQKYGINEEMDEVEEEQALGTLFTPEEEEDGMIEYYWNDNKVIDVIRNMGYDDPEEIAKEVTTVSSPHDFLEMMRNKMGDKDLDITEITLDMFRQSVEDEFEK